MKLCICCGAGDPTSKLDGSCTIPLPVNNYPLVTEQRTVLKQDCHRNTPWRHVNQDVSGFSSAGPANPWWWSHLTNPTGKLTTSC